MKAVNNILVIDHLGNTLNTREAVHEIVRLIEANPCSVIELDFSNVEFMSRSFADEFHKTRLALAERNIEIDILNAAEEVRMILQAVARTQNKSDRSVEKVTVYKFTNPKLVSDYLLSI